MDWFGPRLDMFWPELGKHGSASWTQVKLAQTWVANSGPPCSLVVLGSISLQTSWPNPACAYYSLFQWRVLVNHVPLTDRFSGGHINVKRTAMRSKLASRSQGKFGNELLRPSTQCVPSPGTQQNLEKEKGSGMICYRRNEENQKPNKRKMFYNSTSSFWQSVWGTNM